MEWIYLILVMAFITWSIQIIMVYRRQVDRIKEQIEVVKANHHDVTMQAEDYERRAEILTKEYEELKAQADNLDKTEKKLEQDVMQFRQQSASRRPTRHRVEPGEGASE